MSRTLDQLHSPEVQEALASAGLSRRSELEPERIERAALLATGKWSFATESSRRAFIMEGSAIHNKGGSQMAANGNTQGRGPDPKSARRRILVSAVKQILKAEATEDRGAQELSRKELDAQVRVKSEGSTTPASWVGEACSQALVIEVDGSAYQFTRVKRGVYGLQEVAVPEPEPDPEPEPEAEPAAE